MVIEWPPIGNNWVVFGICDEAVENVVNFFFVKWIKVLIYEILILKISGGETLAV